MESHSEDLSSLVARAIQARSEMLDPAHEGALRLFNGFLEGCPELVIDLYARTAVIFNYAETPSRGLEVVEPATEEILRQMPWIQAILLKTRHSVDIEVQHGRIIYGNKLDRKICESGVWYALDLTMSHDASLYLDSRNLRSWARLNLGGKTVLNTFAYTGSLGVAACAGGASKVVHLDLSRKYLNVGKTSYALNGFPVQRKDFMSGNFYPLTYRLRQEGATFDCVFLDPPFFSQTGQGDVDLNHQVGRLINKVRPLVNDGGWLVVINNALFVSGKTFLGAIDALCAEGYLSIETIIPVPPDFTGFPETCLSHPPIDPAPFNHSTKICVLRVRRKMK